MTIKSWGNVPKVSPFQHLASNKSFIIPFNQTVNTNSIISKPSQPIESLTTSLNSLNLRFPVDQITLFEHELEEMNESDDKEMKLDSVLRKRRLKMKKHKLRKRRRAQRSLKKRLGK